MQDVEKVIKRSRQYWYVDGITELYMGIISLLAGLFYLSLEGINLLVRFLFVPTEAVPFFLLSPWAITVFVSYLLLFIFLAILTLFLLYRATKFRENFTYPRIGYLGSRTSKLAPNLIVATIFIGIQLLLASKFITPIGLFISPDIPANMTLFVGCLFFSCLYLYPAVSSALTRFYVLSALSTFLSIVLFKASITLGMNMILYTTLMGVALLVSGGLTFRNFSRHNPLPKEELVTSNDLENAEQDIGENLTNEEIQEVIKQAPSSLYVDGIGDLYLGGQYLSCGLTIGAMSGFFQLLYSLSTKEIANQLLVVLLGLVGLPVIFWFGFYYFIKIIGQLATALKERFTYPRIGRIKQRIPPLRQRLIMLIKMLIKMSAPLTLIPIILFFLTQQVSKSLPWLLVGTGLAFTYMLLYWAVNLALTRYYILAAVSILLVIVLSQAIISEKLAIILYFVLLGVALLISGGFTFWNFLRQNPLPKEEV
jgi:hypothetical protein